MKEKKRAYCHCKNIDFGTWANTVQMVAPYDIYDILGVKKDSRVVVIDTCIATEIGWLWHQGVFTENSCCGHGKIPPSVVVRPESVQTMLGLGYMKAPPGYARPDETFTLKFHPVPTTL